MTSSAEVIEDNSQLKENETNMDFATSEKQEARAFLRERFLRVITGIVGMEYFMFSNLFLLSQNKNMKIFIYFYKCIILYKFL